jgi:hypothetical protein
MTIAGIANTTAGMAIASGATTTGASTTATAADWWCSTTSEVGQAILPANRLSSRFCRLKGGCGQDWPPKPLN